MLIKYVLVNHAGQYLGWGWGGEGTAKGLWIRPSERGTRTRAMLNQHPPTLTLCTGENLFTWTTETGPRPSQLLCCLLLGETRASSPLWEGASRAAVGPSNLGWTSLEVGASQACSMQLGRGDQALGGALASLISKGIV